MFARYANYYYNAEGEEQRDLIKAYGLRFVIHVTGQAGKFGIFPLLLNIGSGIGLLAIVSYGSMLKYWHCLELYAISGEVNFCSQYKIKQ